MRFILAFLILWPSSVFASTAPQTTPEIDSLVSLISNTPNGKDKVDIYNKIAFQYLFIDTLKALDYIDTATVISENVAYPQGIARAININALHHSFQSRHEEGIQQNKIALSYCNDDDHFVLGKIYNGLGLSYQRMYVVDKCLDYYHKALHHCTEADDQNTMAIVLGNIAGVNMTQGNDKEARKYFLQLEEVASGLEDHTIQYAFNLRFSQFLTHKSEYNESIKYLQSALVNAQALRHNSKIRRVQLQLAINYINLDNFKLGRSHLNKLISRELAPDNVTYMRYQYWNSELERQKGNPQKAIEYAQKGLQKIEEDNDYYFYKPRLLVNLHESESKVGNYENAYRHLRELKAWQDSLELKERENKFIELESKYQSEKKEIENVLLQEQSKSKSATIRQRTLLAIGSFSTLLLALGLAYILFMNSRKDKESNLLLESKVAERTNKLQKSNEELERFAYIASHDLKEPITTIKSFAQVIRNKLKSGNAQDEIDQYLDIIEKSSDQMKFLVTGILDYSKLGEDQDVVEVDLNEIVQKVELYLQQVIDAKNAKIIIQDLPTIRCNPIQIFQVFKNLIENGIKYNESSECVVQISCIENNDLFKIDFKDNGVGIHPEYKDRIFEMFSRLHNRSEYTGSGLGLSIVKKIIHMMKGEIVVLQSDKNGTTFRITLPRE